MEFILLVLAIVMFTYSVMRFQKAKEIVINDFPHPDTYSTPEYSHAFNKAFKEADVKLKHYKA